MATGDLKNNLGVLKSEMRHLQYNGHLDIPQLSLGDPAALLPLLHYILLDFSPFVARFLAQKGYDLYGKKDVRFFETVYRILRDEFNYRPILTKAQFFSMGFSERKLQFLVYVSKTCRDLHASLAKKTQNSVFSVPRLPETPPRPLDSHYSPPKPSYKYVDVSPKIATSPEPGKIQHKDSVRSLDTLSGFVDDDKPYITARQAAASPSRNRTVSSSSNRPASVKTPSPLKSQLSVASTASSVVVTGTQTTEAGVIAQLVDSNATLVEHVMRIANQMARMQLQLSQLQSQVNDLAQPQKKPSTPKRPVSFSGPSSSPTDPERLVSKFYGVKDDSPLLASDSLRHSPDSVRKQSLAIEEKDISELSQPYQRHSQATPFLDVNPFSIPNRLSLEESTEISVYGTKLKSPKAPRLASTGSKSPKGSTTDDYIKAIAERLQQTKALLSN